MPKKKKKLNNASKGKNSWNKNYYKIIKIKKIKKFRKPIFF